MKPLTTNRAGRIGNWPIYAAATASALAGSTSAHAGIIYSGLLNDTGSVGTHQGGGSAGIRIIMGVANFNVGVYHNFRVSSAGGVEINFPGYHGQVLVSTAQHFVKRLASGAKISSGMGYFRGGGDRLFHQAQHFPPQGFWPAASNTGFAAMQFNTGGGGHDLGWLRLSFQDLNGDGSTDKLTLIDYAYNNVAGATITAGDQGVPEPGTFSLALLAAGAAGVLAWRRRRTS